MPSEGLLEKRYQFRKCVQAEQSLMIYIFDLQKLASLCNFCPNCSDENLRDQFISGISSDEIRKVLLEETTLDFKTACNIASNMCNKMAGGGSNTSAFATNSATPTNDISCSSSSDISSSANELNTPVEASLPSNLVHFISATPELCGGVVKLSSSQSTSANEAVSSGSNIVTINTVAVPTCNNCNKSHASPICCYSCKEEGHYASSCPNRICFRCNKKGHFSTNCPQKTVRKYTKSARGSKSVYKPRRAAQPKVTSQVVNNYDIKIIQEQRKS